MSIPLLEQTATVYQLTWMDEHIAIRVDRMHTEKAGVYGEILIQTTAPGIQPHIHGPVHFNFISTNARSQLVKHLVSVVPQDWTGILEQTCYKVVEAHRRGAPAIHIASHEAPDQLTMRIAPIIQEKQATLIFGDGDSLKSFFATFLAVLTTHGATHAGLTPILGNVLFLDYETDVDTFWERVNLITQGLNIAIPEGIYYRPMVQTVADEFPALSHICHEQDIRLIIVDSAAPATVEPEKAERTVPFFQALRGLDVTSLVIAHRTKEGKNEYPFGSSFWRNLPRSNFLVKADRTLDDVAISLKHTKSNNGRRLEPLGFRFMFTDDELHITQAAPVEYPSLAGDVPLRQRLREALRRGMMHENILVETVGEKAGTVNRVLNRYKGKEFTKYGTQWGLLAHDAGG